MILKNDDFIKTKKFHLHEAKLLTKNRNKFILSASIKFNDNYIKETKNELYLNQKRVCKNFKQINTQSINIINIQIMMRKAITSKNQYIAQRARKIYIISLFQSEIAFDFLFATQIINPKKKRKNIE